MFLYPQTLHAACGLKTQLLFWPQVPLPHTDNSLLTNDFPGLSTNRIQSMTTHLIVHYIWICSIPLNSWKQQHWQNISSSSAVLHGPLPLLLSTSPTQPSWFARSMPSTVSHTQRGHTQATSLPAYPHMPVLGTCMCPSLVPQHMILFSYSDLFQVVP